MDKQLPYLIFVTLHFMYVLARTAELNADLHKLRRHAIEHHIFKLVLTIRSVRHNFDQLCS